MTKKIQIENYKILRCDRNRNRGGGSCYLKNHLSFIEKEFFSEETENIFFEIVLPKTKPITIRIIYRLPKQSNFLKTENKNFAKLVTLKKNYTFSDFNINLYQNQNHVGRKINTLVSATVSNDVKNYDQFCMEWNTMYGIVFSRLDWCSQLLLGIVRQATKMNMQDC